MPLCMRLIPDFEINKNPYCFIQDKKGITVIDLMSRKAAVFIENGTKA